MCCTAERPTEGDSGAAVDAGFTLPNVVPNDAGCPEIAGRKCIGAGWYLLGRWSTAHSLTSAGEFYPPTAPVFLDGFALDEVEVSNSDYQAFVSQGLAVAPPANCGGFLAVDADYPLAGYQLVPERSVWTADAGVPESALSRPVTCVTRAEARRFCEWRGGRLPSAYEYFRAARGELPSQRRTPWGDAPPVLDQRALVLDLPSQFYFDYAVENHRDLPTAPPISPRPLGATVEGVRDLAGSVSEFVSECNEELVLVDAGVLVRPTSTAKSQCENAVVVFGGSWYSRNQLQMAGTVSLFAVSNTAVNWAGTCVRVPGLEICAEGQAGQYSIGPTLGSPLPDGPGNERRSWALGFRCAYDLQ